MEWIDLGCYRVQQILIGSLPVTLAAIQTARPDGVLLEAPKAVHIGDQHLVAGSAYPCIEIKASTSGRDGTADQSAQSYQHRLQVMLTATDSKPSILELRIMRYGLGLLKTLDGRGLQPEMSAELIGGNVFYALLDKPWRDGPFVRSVAVEFTVTSITNRGE